MPPQNTIDITQPKSQSNTNGTTTPVDIPKINLNNNVEKQGMLTEKMMLKERSETPPATSVVVPPDGGWGWVVMCASFMCNCMVDGIVFNVGPFVDPIQAEYNASKAEVALISSILTGFYLIGGPFVSAIANKLGFRLCTIIGSIITFLAFGLSYFATNVVYLYFVYGIFGGIGFCFIYMPAVLTVGYYFEKWRALATGIALCGSGIGTAIFAKLIPHWIEIYGWKSTLVMEGVIMLSCCFFAIAFRPIKPIQVTVTKDDDVLPENNFLADQDAFPVVFTKPLPEGRFAYSVPNSSHNTWIGASNNTNYPTAIEVFRGLERRPSQNDQSNINALTKKIEQYKASQKRSGHVTPEENVQHPPIPIILTSVHHELTAVGEAEEENESGQLLEKNDHKPVIVGPRRHTVSGRRPGMESASRSGSRRGSRTLVDANRPLYRDDIFFTGSMARIPQYQSQTSLGYHLSVTHLPTKHDVEEEEEIKKCNICPEAVRRTLATMLDLSLLKSPTFLLMAFSGFFTMMGFFVPFVYIADRAKENGMDKDTTTLIVSAIGISNTVARIICGIISSMQGVNVLHINNIAITAGGIGTILSSYLITEWTQFSYAAVFGICIACFSALRSILVVEFMGLDKLTNAFGLLMLFQGIAAIIGTPVAGLIYDLTHSYTASFWVAGALITLSAVLCYPLNIVNRWENNRNVEQIKEKVVPA